MKTRMALLCDYTVQNNLTKPAKGNNCNFSTFSSQLASSPCVPFKGSGRLETCVAAGRTRPRSDQTNNVKLSMLSLIPSCRVDFVEVKQKCRARTISSTAGPEHCQVSWFEPSVTSLKLVLDRSEHVSRVSAQSKMRWKTNKRKTGMFFFSKLGITSTGNLKSKILTGWGWGGVWGGGWVEGHLTNE